MTASLMLKKLASYPRQNGLAKALREIGRIERTLFILDWFREPTLRQRVQAGLNKGKARNTLARAVFLQLLSHLPPLGWEHINLTGDYIWKSNRILVSSSEAAKVERVKNSLNVQ